ncbi:AhpC/TSA family protein [Flavobacterium sp. SM15]|uniref:TlpA disulfide reductase family protein n=1 Tax=Flavobacterium sp. SM15 TaxID=2908005 RepID=UPI001EDB2FC5|nr:TlpA disulfide reductase family protein [Flavobacterium sp. SM15]MCG2612327.1 AhpC/TSA family protein [Flavobacterium sp. SM15]
MKKVLLLAAFSIMASCSKVGDNEFLITGTAKGFENGTPVILQFQGEMGPVAKDTVKIENGKFEFKGIVDSTDISFIKIDNPNTLVPFILENGELNISIQKDSLHLTKLSGTTNNDKLQKFNEEVQTQYKSFEKFRKDNQAKYMAAESQKDTATVNALMKQMMDLQKSMMEHPKNYMQKNNNEILSVIILENYVSRGMMPLEEIKTQMAKYSKELSATKPALRIKKLIAPVKEVAVGLEAPDFKAPNPEGKMVSLKESLGKVTIIDFWASWCGPCRAENPNVVALYNEFHAKGLNIIGVSLDKDAAKWKEAIAKDNLTWTQVSNLKFWEDPIAKEYSVKSIPATFILDATGKIVAKDLRGAELKAKVAELLAK